jgi:hypothetical protein
MAEQDTGKFRTNTKDQYYTKASVATLCVGRIKAAIENGGAEWQWIEPSAGNGVFLKLGPVGSIGIDIDPKATGILKGDFLNWTPGGTKKRLVYGNPPFGRQGALAKAFIKHATSGSVAADAVAFILPRSFVKPSMNRVFPTKFHCVYSGELDKNAFEVNGEPYDVPCVFQIWVKKTTDRPVAVAVEPVGFTYVKAGEPFHVAFRRVGGLAGQCYAAGATYSAQSHYFLRLDDPTLSARLIEEVNKHVFPSNTVGPRSLSKPEANTVINTILEKN